MKQRLGIRIARTSLSAVETAKRSHDLCLDGRGLEFDLRTKDGGHLLLRKTLNQDVIIKHSSGAMKQDSQKFKNLLLYGAAATGVVAVIRDPASLFFIASGLVVFVSCLFFKPTVRVIFDFVGSDDYIIAEVPSRAATKWLLD